MVHNYFNVTVLAGIGSPVEQPLKICESYQDASRPSAGNQHSPDHPVFPG